VEKKFRLLVEPRYGKERADRILAACWGLEKTRRVEDLMGLFVL
jgi:2-methylcitrate dehydratase